MRLRTLTRLTALLAANVLLILSASTAAAASDSKLGNFEAHPPSHVHRHSLTAPVGLDPATIKSIYNLSGSGSGTIAIVDAYDAPTIATDLNTFSTKFSLPVCDTKNPCFEKHAMSLRVRANAGWALEASLDTEWAHAIAPGAKILLVEANSADGTDLLSAVNYARSRADVVAVSMSWGGSEFSTETSYDSYFTSNHGVAFFASSGDNGTGVSWPAVSANVIGVGGTTLTLSPSKALVSETAWSGSGGGRSAYVNAPAYQTTYGVPNANGKRTVPDVSYDADPTSGVAVYDSTFYGGQVGWFQVGGTSVGAPQWAAIKALGGSVTSTKVYADAKLANSSSFLRDITTGANGTCGFVCTAASGYDYVTGLGSPVTTAF